MKSFRFVGSLMILFITAITFAVIRADAECCTYSSVLVCYGPLEPCPAKLYWPTNICYDGSKLDSSCCCNGPCDIFGCNCHGGCKSNSNGTLEEAIRLFEQRYGVKTIKYI